MSAESWDQPTTNNATSNLDSVPRMGFGRGRKPNSSTNDDEATSTTTKSAFGTSNSFGNKNAFSNGSSGFGGSSFGNNFQSGTSSQPFATGQQGNSKSCFNCQQTGHISRECPNPKQDNRFGNDSRSNRGSFNARGSSRDSYQSGGNFNRGNQFGGGFNQGDNNFRSNDRNDNDQNHGQERTFRSTRNFNGDGPSLSGTMEFTSSAMRGGRGGFNNFGSSSRPDNNNDRQQRDGYEGQRGSNNNGGFRGNRQGQGSGGGYRERQISENPFDSGDRGDQKPKERYIPPPPPTTKEAIFDHATTIGSNFEKYKHGKVQCTPPNRVRPIDLFEEANLGPQIIENLISANFLQPTTIQSYTIPALQGDNDLMACAQTGSGKTAAFLLPIISNLLKNHQEELTRQNVIPSPLCLILSPTRELACQTEGEARKFAYNTNIKIASAIGGHDTFTTKAQMQKGCHILSATTGRLKDMAERGSVSLKHVRYFVLDEADRMLDVGFEPDIRKLEDLGLTPKAQRVTTMFSATFPAEVQRMAKHFLRDDYVFLVVGSIGGANEDINQSIELVRAADKKNRLCELLDSNLNGQRCLIFVETKRSADYLGALLSQKNLMSTTMHGDRTQQQREEAVRHFTVGKCPILVATSVAARGLDFPLIGYVINYDLPDTSDFYVHRIGRTGRAGHLGKSISFFDPDRQSDRTIAPELIAKLREAGQTVPDFLVEYSNGSGDGSYGASSSRMTDVRFRDRGPGNRTQGFPSSGGTAGAGAATSEDWD